MELVKGRHKPFEFAPEDVISNMPDIVITNILNRLPLQDTVRTGVLSRNWKFKWTMLSQLIIDEGFFVYLSKTRGKNNRMRIISRTLLRLSGIITKFVLSIDARLLELDAEDINHWILFLSRKGIKDLTIINRGAALLQLSAHLLSCSELKRLKLCYCYFYLPLGFGFPKLLSLELYRVRVGRGDLGQFVTQCPLLESLNIHDTCSTRAVVEIPKLESLKILSCHLDSLMITDSNTIFELLGSLPKLQELDLDFLDWELTEGDVKKRVSISLPCLKALKLSNIDVDNDMMLSCALELVRSFPNLPFLEITTIKSRENDPTPKNCSFEEDYYNSMGRLQLQNIVFTACCDTSEKDISMIKNLLACSPFLKKLVIHFCMSLDLDEKLIFARKVLKLQQAYHGVDIDLH